MTTRPRSHPLATLEPPPLPPELRARALAAARSARRAPPADLWSRLWASRPLRLLWAAVVLGLLAAHLAIGLRGGPSGSPADEQPLVARTVSDSELTALLELEPIDPDALAQVEARALGTLARRSDQRGADDGS